MIHKVVKNYYLQLFLEECKYVVNEKKINILMTTSDDSDKDISDKKWRMYKSSF